MLRNVSKIFFYFILYYSVLHGQQVKVTSKEIRNKNSYSYLYSIKNDSNFDVIGFDIGLDGNNDKMELSILPVGWSFKKPMNGIRSPFGWDGSVETQEESNFHVISFGVKSNKFLLKPNAYISGFIVNVKNKDLNYLHGHVVVYFKGREKMVIPIVALN